MRFLLRVAFTVPRCKLLHKSINLLCFSRKSETVEKFAQRRHKVDVAEVEEIDVSVHDLFVGPEIVANMTVTRITTDMIYY